MLNIAHFVPVLIFCHRNNMLLAFQWCWNADGLEASSVEDKLLQASFGKTCCKSMLPAWFAFFNADQRPNRSTSVATHLQVINTPVSKSFKIVFLILSRGSLNYVAKQNHIMAHLPILND